MRSGVDQAIGSAPTAVSERTNFGRGRSHRNTYASGVNVEVDGTTSVYIVPSGAAVVYIVSPRK